MTQPAPRAVRTSRLSGEYLSDTRYLLPYRAGRFPANLDGVPVLDGITVRDHDAA
jgi:hypothetical protein